MTGLLFTYLLTYGGALASLFNPFVGLLVYVVFAIIKPEVTWSWSVSSGNYSRIVAIALLLGWVGRGFGTWQFSKASFSILSFGTFFITAIVSAVLADNQKIAWGFVEAMAKIGLPVLVGVTTIDSMAKLRQLAWVIILSLAFLAFNENERYFRGGWIERDNMLAQQMVLAMGLSLGLAFTVTSPLQKLGLFVATLLSAHAIMIHLSRGAMLGGIVCLLVTFLFSLRYLNRVLLFIGMFLIIGRLAGPAVHDRFATTFVTEETRDTSAQSRLDLWRDMLTEIQRNPLFGIGPNHWPLIAHKHGWPPGKEGHGLWIQIACECGLIGGLAYCFFYLSCLKRLLPIAWARNPSDAYLSGLAASIVAGLSGFIVAAQFGSFEGLESPYYTVLLGAGILILYSRIALITNPGQFVEAKEVKLSSSTLLPTIGSSVINL